METNDISIIRQLLDMDKKARKMVEDAEEERLRAETALVDEKVRVEEDILAKAQNRIVKLKNKTADDASKETRVITDEGQQILQRLEANYADYHAQWEDELFTRCISMNR